MDPKIEKKKWRNLVTCQRWFISPSAAPVWLAALTAGTKSSRAADAHACHRPCESVLCHVSQLWRGEKIEARPHVSSPTSSPPRLWICCRYCSFWPELHLLHCWHVCVCLGPEDLNDWQRFSFTLLLTSTFLYSTLLFRIIYNLFFLGLYSHYYMVTIKTESLATAFRWFLFCLFEINSVKYENMSFF